MQGVRTKRNIGRICIVIAAAAAALVAVIVALLLIHKSVSLSNALKKLDVTDEKSVVRVMKYGRTSYEAVMRVANDYNDAGMYSEAAVVLLYTAQYLSPDDAVMALIQKCYESLGASEAFINQFTTPQFTVSDFDIISTVGDTGYGASDGVYISCLGGYVKAKISPVLPLSVWASPEGVYVHDSADGYAKLISRDGAFVKAVSDTPLSEFLYYENCIYTIDSDGIPHGLTTPELNAGEHTARLRISDGSVVCTVYDESYNMLRDITL